VSPGTLQTDELKHRDSSKLHKRKKPPSSRFFDLDTSGDSISLDMRKPKHLGFKRKKQKRLLEEPRGSVTSKVKQKRIKRRTKGSIGIDFKKQARLITQQKKAVRLASIDDTIAEVIEPMEGDKEDENEKNIQDKTKKNMQDVQE
jgi:hypothetical protein